ncbi:MAG: beta-ketoacyl-[acyl-carrier-protein] synthase family protein [Deltaproteobacteria bacterium]|nr:beta-ketoacyl-[acyl-carrier-protein] synthase family protein [Deltaproteobacteria bacterium]
MKTRVVITGMGTINPIASSLEEFREALWRGRSGITRWRTLDLTGVACQVGGDLGDFDFDGALSALKGRTSEQRWLKLRRIFRSSSFAAKMAALTAMEAVLEAGLAEGPDRNFGLDGIVVAGHDFNHNYILSHNLRFERDPALVGALVGIEGLDSNIAATLSDVLGVTGPAYTVGGACASGNLALRDAYREILSGECKRVLVAAPPFDITASDIYSMTLLGAVVTDPLLQATPHSVSRPFDRRRAGFVPAHGSGALVLEELECAKERGAVIYGELAAVKAASQANRLPIPDSAGQAALIKDLISSSGLKPEDIDYINCHATSTKIGDLHEIQSIKLAFGDHAYRLKLNSTKSMLGHLTWSAALVETIAVLLQIQQNKLHPSINIQELDNEIDLDVCANQPQTHQINNALKNSFGFGGISCCTLIKRYDDHQLSSIR